MFYVLKMLRFVKFSRKQYDESANGAVFACSFERAVAVYQELIGWTPSTVPLEPCYYIGLI